VLGNECFVGVGGRCCTRIHLTAGEAEALTVIGSVLGSVYRGELAGRIGCGVLDREGRAAWRAERKQAITAVSSSRWAGAITRAVEDQYQLGMRGLAAHAADLRAAVEVLEQRCALRPGELADPANTRGRRRRGYRSASERFAKTRRLALMRGRLADAEHALAAGRPSVAVGGKRLWRNRHHLDAAAMSEAQWRDRWDGARMFLTADGESGKAGGNETIRVDEAGRLRVKVPAALTAKFGSHLQIAAPVGFAHRGQQWSERVAGRSAVRYDISYDPAKDRWYLDASWTHDVTAAPPPIEALRAGPVLGVDLNADHLACCILDRSGNPVGASFSIPVETAGLPASRRDGRVRAAITALLDRSAQHNCTAVVIGIPTAKFRTRLTSMAARRGTAVIGVDAAYTSRWGAQHWAKPLQQQTSEPVTGHHAAAAAIGRRGLGLAIRRRPAGPRTGQRTAAGTPPTRPHRPPGHGGRHGSSGPPTSPP
jgi:hypothetical protein